MPKHLQLLLTLALLLVLLPTSLDAQRRGKKRKNRDNPARYERKNPHADRYLDLLDPDEEILLATYTRVHTDRNDTFISRTFFPETRTLTAYAEFYDRQMKINNGRYATFYDDGSPKETGQFHDDKRTGQWTSHSHRGYLKESGLYTDDERSGEWKMFHADGSPRGTKQYRDGKLHGEYILFDSAGVVREHLVYTDGNVTETLVADQAPSTFKKVEVMPHWKGCESIEDPADRKSCADREMLMFVYGNIRYPASARENDVEGMAIISFVVEKDGRVTEPYVLRGLNQGITDELYRIVGLMPDWNPGMQDGKPVRVQFNLPIKFKLE